MHLRSRREPSPPQAPAGLLPAGVPVLVVVVAQVPVPEAGSRQPRLQPRIQWLLLPLEGKLPQSSGLPQRMQRRPAKPRAQLSGEVELAQVVEQAARPRHLLGHNRPYLRCSPRARTQCL